MIDKNKTVHKVGIERDDFQAVCDACGHVMHMILPGSERVRRWLRGDLIMRLRCSQCGEPQEL